MHPWIPVLSTATHFVLLKYKDHGTILSAKKKDERQLITIISVIKYNKINKASSGIRKFFDIVNILWKMPSLSGVGEPDFETPYFIRDGIYSLERVDILHIKLRTYGT